MLSANDASLVNAVAKPRSAPGARSWRISSIAVPSSPSPACPGSTSTSGSSPVSSDSSSESTPSERAHSFTPMPVTPLSARTSSAAWAASPSEVTTACGAICAARSAPPGAPPWRPSTRVETVRAMRAVIAPTAASTRRTAARPAIFSSASIGTEARIEPTRRDAYSTFAPASANCPSSFCETCARMSTSVVSAAVTFTPVRSCGAARADLPARTAPELHRQPAVELALGRREILLDRLQRGDLLRRLPAQPRLCRLGRRGAGCGHADDGAGRSQSPHAQSMHLRLPFDSRAARPGERAGASGAGNYPCVRPR